jgi:hypothetical protein
VVLVDRVFFQTKRSGFLSCGNMQGNRLLCNFNSETQAFVRVAKWDAGIYVAIDKNTNKFLPDASLYMNPRDANTVDGVMVTKGDKYPAAKCSIDMIGFIKFKDVFVKRGIL